MNRITILGANSLIGQHLISALQSFNDIKSINFWDESKKFVYRLSGNFV